MTKRIVACRQNVMFTAERMDFDV